MKKLLNTICMDDSQFQKEVSCLMRVRHKNIVRFLGYCADTQGKMESYKGKLILADERQRFLCFEYLPNGSLEKYINGMIVWCVVMFLSISISFWLLIVLSMCPGCIIALL